MKKALVVDDQAENRYLLRTVLEAEGWTILEASSGAQALDMAREHPPELVVSDVMMPDMDGFSLCRAWKADPALQGIPFIFCTASFIDAEDEALAIKLGSDGFIRQPVDPPQLRQQLRQFETGLGTGKAVRAKTQDSGDTKILEDYSKVLGRKLDQKVAEYRKQNEQLEQSKLELEAKSEELTRKLKELTCFHAINTLARELGASEDAICQAAVNELREAFPSPQKVHVRIHSAEHVFTSVGFRQTEHFLKKPIGGGAGLPRRGLIELFVEGGGDCNPQTILAGSQLFIDSVSNLLGLEIERVRRSDDAKAIGHRTATLLRLSNDTREKTERVLVQDYLEAAVELTGSRIGYLHLVNDDQETIELLAWSEATMKDCETVHDTHYSISKAGIWADCVRNRVPAVHNDYANEAGKKGLPGGHVEFRRHLSVPVLDDEKVTMILGVGDREQPYLKLEIETCQQVAESLWRNVSQRRAAAMIESSNARLQLLEAGLKAASHAIVITDSQGTIEWVNPAFTEITGYAAEEAIGGNPRLLKSGKQSDSVYADMWMTIAAGKVWHGNLVNKRKDGTLYHEVASITPVRDQQGEIRHYIAIKQDVTEQHVLEEKLLRAQRMESIGLLAGGVAHDLNNVLAPILMSVDMLRQDLTRDIREELIGSLQRSCERGADIIKQVLTFARGVEGERVLVQVRHILKDLIRMAKETFPPDMEYVMDVPGDLHTVLGDATQLHQVFMNLVVNARDAMPDGGRLEILGENVRLEDKRGYLDVEIPAGDYVCLSVRDSGSGIEPAIVDRIFEPFYTTKATGQGTGLGLPTSLGIVKSHGGLLELETALGKGTLFRVWLPAADAKVAEPEVAEALLPKGNGETVLLVDDEESIRRVMGHALEHNGYRVITAGDGAEAVGLFAREMDRVAVVVTDVVMPVMDGLATVKALRAVKPDIRVIGASGFVGEGPHSGRMEELQKLGVANILGKPFSVEDLLRAVAAELADS